MYWRIRDWLRSIDGNQEIDDNICYNMLHSMHYVIGLCTNMDKHHRLIISQQKILDHCNTIVSSMLCRQICSTDIDEILEK